MGAFTRSVTGVEPREAGDDAHDDDRVIEIEEIEEDDDDARPIDPAGLHLIAMMRPYLEEFEALAEGRALGAVYLRYNRGAGHPIDHAASMLFGVEQYLLNGHELEPTVYGFEFETADLNVVVIRMLDRVERQATYFHALDGHEFLDNNAFYDQVRAMFVASDEVEYEFFLVIRYESADRHATDVFGYSPRRGVLEYVLDVGEAVHYRGRVESLTQRDVRILE